MTRKDYQLIAEAIKAAKIDMKARKEIVRHLGYKLADDNYRFRMGQFAEACGAVMGPPTMVEEDIE